MFQTLEGWNNTDIWLLETKGSLPVWTGLYFHLFLWVCVVLAQACHRLQGSRPTELGESLLGSSPRENSLLAATEQPCSVAGSSDSAHCPLSVLAFWILPRVLQREALKLSSQFQNKLNSKVRSNSGLCDFRHSHHNHPLGTIQRALILCAQPSALPEVQFTMLAHLVVY